MNFTQFSTPPCWNTTNRSHVAFTGEVAVGANGRTGHLSADPLNRERTMRHLTRLGGGPVAIIANCANCAAVSA